MNTVAVAKIGKNVLTSTDPNDFVFHSAYNTFKIILEGTKSITLSASTNNQLFTQSHSLTFIPLLTAFAKESSRAQVFLPNGVNIATWGAKAGWGSSGVQFNYTASDDTYLYFNFSNSSASSVSVDVRYFVLERL